MYVQENKLNNLLTSEIENFTIDKFSLDFGHAILIFKFTIPKIQIFKWIIIN